MKNNQSVLQLNLALNNLFICVLVKSFEVVFMGFAVSVNRTRYYSTRELNKAE